MASETFQMDLERAEQQVDFLEKCFESLEQSRQMLEEIRKDQTALLWTADGKAVELTAVLRSKYQAGVKWLAVIGADLEESRLNLRKAIDDTLALDDTQKAAFQTLLYRVAGPMKPIAI